MTAITPVEQTLIELLKIDSPTGGELELADTVENWVKQAGWRVRRHGLCLIAVSYTHLTLPTILLV